MTEAGRLIMNRYGPSTIGRSKATPQTICQKCLKRDDYECKSTTQERPYVSRPSRTQQLSNPKLVPKLTSDTPNELLRKKGIADEELARKEAERGRERKPDADASGSIRTRSRSASSYTSTSVSTISTNRSHSPSRRTSHIAERKYGGARSRRRSFSPNRREARTSSSSAVSHASKSSHARPSNGRSRRHDDTRHQRSMSRHGEHAPFPSATRKRQRESSSSSRSYSSDYSMRRQRRDRYGDGARGGDRNTRRRRSSVSPDTRGRDRSLPRGAGKRRTMSRSDSMDRSRVAQGRHSMTPTSPPLHPLQARANGRGLARNTQHRDSIRRQDQNAINPKVRSSTRNGGGGLENRPQQALPLRKERSLSPFSKRLALTQAMNMGHR